MKTYKRIIVLILAFAMVFSNINFTHAAEEDTLPWPDDFFLGGQEMPFRPEDKYVCEQNPPDFSWPMIENASSYEVRVCRDEKMTDVAYEKAGIKTNFYNFDTIFEIGKYYWSVRFVVGGKYSEWTPPRRFRIDPDAWEFPVPDMETLISRIPKTHPRIWTTEKDLDEFRKLAKGPAKEYIEELTMTIRNDYMTKPFPAEPTLVRTGDYVEDTAGKSDLRANAAVLQNIMLESAFVFLITGDKEIGRFGVAALMELTKWDPNGVTGYATQDQVHREISYKSAYAYDWLYPIMTEAERTQAISMIRTRTATMANHLVNSSKPIWKMPYDSHGWNAFNMIGTICVAMYGDMPEAKMWLEKVMPVAFNRMPPWSNEDGGWSQGTDYWQYSSSSDQAYAIVYTRAGILNFINKAYYHNELYYPLYMYPKGSYGAFGDSSEMYQPRYYHLGILETMVSVFKDPIAKWLREQIGPPERRSLISYFTNTNDDVESKPPLNLPRAHTFKDVGITGMHSDLVDPKRISMFFRSSPYGSISHAHPDQNSFVIQAYGQRLAIDSGYYDAYNSAHDTNYTRKTYAHNSVTFDGGKGQPLGNINAKGFTTNFLTHPQFDLVKGEAAQAYMGELSKFDRIIVYVRPDTFIVIDDLAAAKGKKSSFEWWLNAHSDISVYESGTGARITRNEAVLDAKLHYPQNTKVYYSNLFSGPDLVHIPPGGSYANSVVNKRIWFETEKVEKTKMVVTLDVHKKSEKAQYIKTQNFDNYVILQFEDGTRAYVKTIDADEVTAGNIRFNGAAVVVKGDTMLLASGTFLEVKGKTIVKADKDCSVVVGLDEIGLSSWDDNNISVYMPNVTSIKNYKDKNISQTGGEYGLLWKQNGDMVDFTVDKGHYQLLVNDKKIPGDRLEDNVVQVEIDGVKQPITLGAYQDFDGGINSAGTMKNVAALYKIVDKSDKLELLVQDVKPGDVLLLPDNLEFKCSDYNQYITLQTVPMQLIESETIDDYDKMMDACDVVVEAENFVERGGATVTYDTRKFLSNGVGLSLMNTKDDFAKYIIKVPEKGEYDLVIKYVAWLDKTERLLRIGDLYGKFELGKTESWGTTPEQWKTQRIKMNKTLEAGDNELILQGFVGNWNIDWIGLIKSGK